MVKRNSIIAIAVAFTLLFAMVSPASAWFGSNDDTPRVVVGDTQAEEALHTEKNHAWLMNSNPAPTLTSSLERENLIKRLNFLNDENRIFYVYLLSNDGKVITYYTAQGKVSSVNSKLTTGEQIVESPYVDSYNGAAGNYGVVVESPALDGSYGTNGDGIFFFTMEGAYIEWNGKYLVSSQPMSITTPPELHMEV